MDIPWVDWNLSGASDAATIVAGIGAAIALFYTGRQLQHSRHVATADLLLHIDELMTQYNEIHRQLVVSQFLSRNPQLKKPADHVERLTSTFEKTSYMGLLERVKILIDKKLIDIDTVHHLYGHRVQILVQDPEVSQWLKEQADGWHHFIALDQALVNYRHHHVRRGTGNEHG